MVLTNFFDHLFLIYKRTFSIINNSIVMAITEISYDKQDISWGLLYSNSNGNGDLPNL